MQDISSLTTSVRTFLDESQGLVEASSDVEWQPQEGFTSIIYRTVLRRQFDCLRAIVELVSRGHGHAATTLLRPSCEELIWVKYLRSIDPTHAEKLILNFAALETWESLQAQENHVGRTVMENLGFSRQFLTIAKQNSDKANVELKALGDKLGWNKRRREDSKVARPSVQYVAKSTGSLELYNFLYHATSRSVHFSVTELLRRAWGSHGKLSIRSVHWRNYWSAFALSWGLRLYLETLIEILEALPNLGELGDSTEVLNEQRILDAAKLVQEFGAVPIITREEMEWPEDW
jgi:hypothetical protein